MNEEELTQQELEQAQQELNQLQQQMEQQEQLDQQQMQQQSQKKKQSLGDRVDQVKEGVDKFGKNLENVGKLEEKAADVLDGGKKATKAAGEVGSKASSASEKSAQAAQKAAEARAKVAHATAEAAKATREGAEKAKAGSAATTKAGAATTKAGVAVTEAGAAGSAAYGAGVPVAVAGAGITAAGATTTAAGASGTAAAGTVEASAGAAEAAARAAELEAKAEAAAAGAAVKAAQTSKAGSDTAKKASDMKFSDKLRQRGKLNQARGKQIQEKSKNFDSEKLIDRFFGETSILGKLMKGVLKFYDPKVVAIVMVIITSVAPILITYLLSPMFFMDMIRQNVSNTVADPDNIEKVQNYIAGLGFQDSEQAFYKEVNYLNTHYDKNLDFPYIMSALYYIDIYYGKSEYFVSDGNKSFCKELDMSDAASRKICSKNQVGYNLAKYYLNAAGSTTGSDGLVYSANKLYRLRQLAKAQFLGEKELTSATLDEYIEICIQKMDNESQNLAKYFPWLIGYIIAHSEIIPGAGATFDTLVAGTTELKKINDLIKIFEGTESWESIKLYTENGKYDAGLITALKNFITTFFECFTNVESVEFSITSDDGSEPTSGVDAVKNAFETWTTALASLTDITKLSKFIKVNYYEYSFSQDEFENYLVDHYIREMPEFYDIIKDANGKISDDKVYQLAYEIKVTKKIFDDLYKKDASAQETNTCNGDINLDLLAELHTPIDMTVGQTMKFAGPNNYGLYKGLVHNGVDLEDSSTGTKAGDKVYSVYDGVVTSSTADGTYPDKTAKGGWVTIQYYIQYKDNTLGNSKLAERFKSVTSTIVVYYGGMDAKKLTLKEGSTVKKGEVIGYVGSAAESENGLKPSLHIGVYDLKTGGFLNPVNMFITCKRSASSKKVCGTKNIEKVWTFLLSKGYPKEAAAGIMGVWKRESGFKPYIVQSHTDVYSKKYTTKVDNGKISRDKFANKGPGGGGYGLAQWTTSGRKENLYDFAKKKSKSVGDLELQLEFFEKEMKSNSYKKVRSKLMKATTVEEATKIFLRDYEGGGSSSLKLRTSYAKEIYEKYKNYECK